MSDNPGYRKHGLKYRERVIIPATFELPRRVNNRAGFYGVHRDSRIGKSQYGLVTEDGK